MAEEENCVNEKRALLQDCLPGVTLNNGNAYYHRRQHSYLSPRHQQEIDQLQQQILISNAMNKMSADDSHEQSTVVSPRFNSEREPNVTSVEESSSIHVLWIDKDNNVDSYSSGDEFDDIASYSFSIRKAAARSEAKRRTEEQYFLYLKLILVVILCFWLWDEFLPTTTNNNTTNVHSTWYKRRFRFNRQWNKEVNSMYIDQQDGRDDNEKRKILVLLKDLDEAIHGDIVLRSNKTNFLDAARVWQREDCTLHEPSLSPSSAEQKLPPLAIVKATTVNDVKLAVPILGGLARDYHLEFRVRSGGYAYMSGYSTISDGVMLSLANFNTIKMNDQNRYEIEEQVGGIVNATETLIGNNETDATSATNTKTVVMGPGVRTEDFMKEVLDDNGYSSIVASAAGVGMGGFILGGGYGLQSRMYGLAIDNVVGLQVVLPSGELKEVKKDDELFWALCGAGGGNIGVVTSMEYQVYPSHDIKLTASIKVSLKDMTEFLQRLGDKESDLAPEFTLIVQGYSRSNNTTNGLYQHGSRTSIELNALDQGEENGLVTISMYWMGDSNPDDPVGMKYIKNEIVPLFSNETIIDDITYYYFSWSGMSREREQNDELKSVWSAQSWNGFLLPSNNTQEIWMDIHSSLSAMFMYCKFVSPRVELWGGAISKIPSNATVFPHRNAVYNIGVDVIVPTESDADAASDEIQLVNAIWPSIERHLNGVYVNYPMASLSNDSYPAAYWGENLDRLVTLAERYDPSRALTVAQSIPTVTNDTFSEMNL